MIIMFAVDAYLNTAVILLHHFTCIRYTYQQIPFLQIFHEVTED